MSKFFDCNLQVRLQADDMKRLERAVERDDEKYSSVSHFIRVAVLKLLREEDKQKQVI